VGKLIWKNSSTLRDEISTTFLRNEMFLDEILKQFIQIICFRPVSAVSDRDSRLACKVFA
jgi:hypothetical protein